MLNPGTGLSQPRPRKKGDLNHDPASRSPQADTVMEAYRDLPLEVKHIEILVSRGIDPYRAATAGLFTATTKAQLRDLGFKPNQQLPPGLVIPIYNTLGDLVSYQLRPDTPRSRAGKIVKYETLAGSQVAMCVPVSVRALLRDESIPLFVTEGPLKALAAASQGICCVAILGAWNFKT
jgi:Domain of unknown function (DUF3854)